MKEPLPLVKIMDMPMDMMDIPLDILISAQKIENWMSENNYKKWELLGICSRNHAWELKELKDKKGCMKGVWGIKL